MQDSKDHGPGRWETATDSGQTEVQTSLRQVILEWQSPPPTTPVADMQPCPHCGQRFGVERIQTAAVPDRRRYVAGAPTYDSRLERRKNTRRASDAMCSSSPARFNLVFQCMACDYEWLA